MLGSRNSELGRCLLLIKKGSVNLRKEVLSDASVKGPYHKRQYGNGS